MTHRPQRLHSGVVLQGGLDARPRPARSMEHLYGLYRAIVINTYVSDSDDVIRKHEVECDVIMIARSMHLPRVPVAQANHGVNNAQLWVPRPSTRAISTGTALNLTLVDRSGVYQGPVTGFGDLDGDMVLVEFIEGDAQSPVITKALSHEKTKRVIVSGSGWAESGGAPRGTPHKDEFFVSHAGSEVRINAKGDVLIDTVGATADLANEVPSTDAGQVRLRLKDGQKLTIECDGTDVFEVYKDGSGVHVDIGEGAMEKMVLGDSFMTLFNAHTHLDAFGGTGVTLVAQQMTAAQLSAQHKVK